MRTDLNPGELLSQPYNIFPWYYDGPESVVAIPNDDIVDWVLIELRDTTQAGFATGETMIARRAAFLLKDGSVVDLNGTDKVCFPPDMPVSDSLFVVIWHRNHLGILSANPLQKTGDFYPYDFTTGADMVYGGILGYKELADGIWGMVSADGDADGQVSNTDKNNVWAVQAGSAGYYSGDFSLDSQINNTDKNLLWMPNSGRGGQVPDEIVEEFECQVPQ